MYSVLSQCLVHDAVRVTMTMSNITVVTYNAITALTSLIQTQLSSFRNHMFNSYVLDIVSLRTN